MFSKLRKLRKFLSYYNAYKGLLTVNLLCSILVAALALVLPIIVRYITGTLIVSGESNILTEIIRAAAVMLAIITAQTGCAIFYAYKGHDMGAKIERDMRGELFEHYQRLSFSFFDNQKTGQLMSRLSHDLNNLSEMLHHTPENIVLYGTQFFGSLIILFLINWRLTLVICIPITLMLLYSFPFYRKMARVKEESYKQIADVNALAQENLSGIRTVKSFAAEEEEIRKFGAANALFYRSRKQIYKYEAFNFETITFFFRPLITVAIVAAGGFWITTGELAPTDLLIFIMYAAYLTEPIPQLAFMVEQVQEGMIGYRRFREIIDTAPDVCDADDATPLAVTAGRVTFDNVTFRYHDRQDYVISNINLEASPGETVAIVGRSGIGKTTLCSLIPRFYETCSGDVRIDGVSVRDVTHASLRRQIGVVSQDVFLFSGSVMENILYGKPDATKEDVIDAAKKANIHDFIEGLPDGYDTDIGQRGVKLSGGQQQRISIARVFLKNPAILILDEATSSLDYESEQAVIDSLRALSEGRTTFIIAHRESAIKNADRIVVLDDKQIAEQGTHEQLAAAGGVYANLYCRPRPTPTCAFSQS